MSDAPGDEPNIEEMAPYKLEPARSSRSRCKTCKRKIDKGGLRLGVLVDGAYGPGYMWNHLKCLARRQIEAVQEAYAGEHWEPGLEVPLLTELEQLAEKAAEDKKNKKTAPYVEIAPSGRSKCKSCGESIAQGTARVVLLRTVEFYGQTRGTPVNVHPGCVRAELDRDDSAIDRMLLFRELEANTADLPRAALESAMTEIGDLD